MSCTGDTGRWERSFCPLSLAGHIYGAESSGCANTVWIQDVRVCSYSSRLRMKHSMNPCALGFPSFLMLKRKRKERKCRKAAIVSSAGIRNLRHMRGKICRSVHTIPSPINCNVFLSDLPLQLFHLNVRFSPCSSRTLLTYMESCGFAPAYRKPLQDHICQLLHNFR